MVKNLVLGFFTVLWTTGALYLLVVWEILGEGSLFAGDNSASILGYWMSYQSLYSNSILLVSGALLCGFRLLQKLGKGPKFIQAWNSLPALALTISIIVSIFFVATLSLNARVTAGIFENLVAVVFTGKLPEAEKPQLKADATLDLPDLPFTAPVRDPYELKLTDLDGNESTLAAMKGKVVFLNFWATWCPPCRAEMPNLQALWESVKDQENIVFVAISSEDQESVKKFIGENKYTFPVYTTGEELPPAFKNISSIPTTIILSQDGTFVYDHSGAIAWDGGITKQFLLALANNKAFAHTPLVEEAAQK